MPHLHLRLGDSIVRAYRHPLQWSVPDKEFVVQNIPKTDPQGDRSANESLSTAFAGISLYVTAPFLKDFFSSVDNHRVSMDQVSFTTAQFIRPSDVILSGNFISTVTQS